MLVCKLSRFGYLVSLVALLTLPGCGMYDDVFDGDDFGPEFEQRRSELENFCQVRVTGYGTLNVEEQYLAQVVSCEHAGAPMETLKAQAIAARGYAAYATQVDGRALAPNTTDQSYNCGRPITDAARQAVRETSGMVLTHNGKLIMPFYVAGSTNVDANTCRAKDNAGTQKYVTYNQGKTGGAVTPSSIGHPANPANRGAMSQNGSACLARQGWSAERILRSFYGDDIRVTKLSGSCVLANTDPNLGKGGASTTPPPATPPASSGNSCDADNTSRPAIVSRATWGARAPRSNRPTHTPNRFTIHHTVTTNNDTNPMATVRQVQKFHMDSNGWSDIGYHFLVDQQGRIYAGNPENRIGAHVGNNNTGNLGISFLGNYETLQPTDAQLRAAGQLIRHLANKYNIPLNASKIKGHRDYNATACPGRLLYPRLGTILNYAKSDTASGECTPELPQTTPQPTALSYKYVRVRAVSDEPAGFNDTIDGFELDALFGQSADGRANYYAQSARATGSVTNVNAVTGAPNNDSCDNRASTVAGIRAGGAVIAELSRALTPGDRVRIVQANYHTGLSDCSPSGTAEVAVSPDGVNWTILSREVVGNATLEVKGAQLRFTKPTAASEHGRRVDLAVSASGSIARVEYLADDWSLGASRQGPDFTHQYDFQNTGNRKLEARGYDSTGRLVAVDRITIKVADGSKVELLKPLEGSQNGREVTFHARASKDVKRVDYLADNWKMGSSTQAPQFAFNYRFDYTGVRTIEAKAYNAQGKLVAVDRISITVQDQSFVKFSKPTNGSTLGRNLSLQVTSSPDVVQVEYFADDWTLGSSRNTSTFPHSYTLQSPGVRKLEARAYNAQGKIIAVDRITVTVKDDAPAASALADKLGKEGGTCSAVGNGGGAARCTDGRGGWSSADCWKYVKAALIRAGVASRADIDRLASAVGMSAYDVQVSAAGFKRAADRASAQTLRSTVRLQKVNTPPSQAPRGAVIAWGAGCQGAHSRYGHIEVAMGDGYACSDYCARLRPNASCASVYVPVD